MREKADRARQTKPDPQVAASDLPQRRAYARLLAGLTVAPRRSVAAQPRCWRSVAPASKASNLGGERQQRCDRCAPASANVLAKARERPWMVALPSCCHAGGAWHGLCGRSWPHSFRELFSLRAPSLLIFFFGANSFEPLRLRKMPHTVCYSRSHSQLLGVNRVRTPSRGSVCSDSRFNFTAVASLARSCSSQTLGGLPWSTHLALIGRRPQLRCGRARGCERRRV